MPYAHGIPARLMAFSVSAIFSTFSASVILSRIGRGQTSAETGPIVQVSLCLKRASYSSYPNASYSPFCLSGDRICFEAGLAVSLLQSLY